MNRTVIFLGAVVVIAGGAAFLLRDTEEVVVPVYQLVPVATRDIVVSASAAGSIEPIRTVEVKSKASGEIFAMQVETGDVVRAGELLVRVDSRVPQATLRQAQADLELAQAQLENAQSRLRRSEELYATQSITEQEHDDARLAVASARAQLVRAQRSLEDARISAEDTEVRAPITGVIIVKAVEEGTVITSATQGVSGGTVLLRMANLDTVQVRALVDETDIGKVRPGLEVSITVDAFRNRQFSGEVLKIEPQATVVQNVTMFPVLVRIPNSDGLLRPGMNVEVEVHVASRQGVLAIPNAALRTDRDRDVAAAAAVLGLDPEEVQQQIAEARRAGAETGGQASHGATMAGDSAGGGHSFTTPDGREIQLPEGVSAEQVQSVLAKMRGGGGRAGLSADDRALLGRLFQRGGGGDRGGMGGGGMRGGRQASSTDAALLGGSYIVFVLRDGIPTAVPIRTGLTDLDYSEVMTGITEADTVLVLPSASLLASQQQWQERMNRMGRGGLPGISRN